MNLREFTQLKEEVESLQRKLDRSLGAKDQLKSTLFEKFDCVSVKEAYTKLEKLKEEIAQEDEEFQRDLTEFRDEFADQLSKEN